MKARLFKQVTSIGLICLLGVIVLATATAASSLKTGLKVFVIPKNLGNAYFTTSDSFKSGGAIFTAITTGAALLALIVGGLSVINTMLMAVTERVREIGLKKAVGARIGHIMREYVLEAVVIGAIGGTIGLLLGWGVTSLVNAATASSNLTLFLVSWRLVIVAILFSVGLGAAAGIIPAFRASRMDPVQALRAA